MALAGAEAVGTGGQSERYLADARLLARVSKLQPAKPVHPAREAILTIMKKWYINTKNLLIW